MGREDSASRGTTWAGMILTAVVMTPCFWCILAGILPHSRPANPHPYASATAAVLCGLAGWLAYHLVTRRDNVFVMFLLAQSAAQARLPFWPTLGLHLPLTAAMGAGVGIVSRFLVRDGARPVSSEPLYDAQIDHPS